jgi:hypothetical protein
MYQSLPERGGAEREIVEYSEAEDAVPSGGRVKGVEAT